MERPVAISRLLISNLPSGVGDQELIALAAKYAPELECIDVRRFASQDNHPAAQLSFMHMNLNSLEELSRRLSGMYWKGRTLMATALIDWPSASAP